MEEFREGYQVYRTDGKVESAPQVSKCQRPSSSLHCHMKMLCLSPSELYVCKKIGGGLKRRGSGPGAALWLACTLYFRKVDRVLSDGPNRWDPFSLERVCRASSLIRLRRLLLWYRWERSIHEHQTIRTGATMTCIPARMMPKGSCSGNTIFKYHRPLLVGSRVSTSGLRQTKDWVATMRTLITD